MLPTRLTVWLFALGLLASAVLAIPILAATSGYVVGATFEWRRSLDEPLSRSTWRFYAVMLGILALGATLSLLAVEPIEMLVIASIAGGLGTPVLLALLLRLARSRRVMGEHRIAGPWMIIGWTTTAIVSLASLVYLVQPLLPP